MTTQATGKIFLSDERGCTETALFRSYNTFSFGKYRHKHKQAFGNLCVLNDDTLAGGHSIKLTIEESSIVLLLPMVGAVIYNNNNGGNTGVVNSGEMQTLHMDAGSEIEISNPYEDELVNFLQLWIKVPSAIGKMNRLHHFNLENKNTLLPVTSTKDSEQHPWVVIGKFTGRHEAVYKAASQNNVFVFVIQGVFEVKGRLLHARDGLALWNEPYNIEMEALSNDAIVFIVELAG